MLLPSREGARQLVAPFCQPREQAVATVDISLDAGAVLAQPSAQFQVVFHALPAQHPPPFGAMAEAQLHGALGADPAQVAPMPTDGTLGEGQEPGGGAQGCAFAGSVGAQKGDEFTAVHRDVDALEGGDAAVAHHQIPELEQGSRWRGHAHPAPPR